MSSPAPNPLQPLVTQISRLCCRIEELLTKIGIGIGEGGGEGEGVPGPTIVFVKERSDSGSMRVFSIGSAVSVKIASKNTDRISIIVQNQGAANLYIGYDSQVDTNYGIKIFPGGCWSSETWVGEIYGISDGINITTVSIEEVSNNV
jgi:hypothetical protein